MPPPGASPRRDRHGAVQPALPLWRRRARQDPPDACHRLAHPQARSPQRRVIYLSAEKFMYQFIRALRFKDTMAFKEQFRSVDVLMIDDVQFISGKDSTQEEFFHTFNALVDQNRQIVISADKSPSDLEGLEERMRSRLGWGLVADIHPTTYELRLGILQSKAEQLRRARCRRRCWSSSPTRSPPTSASSRARSTASSRMRRWSAAPITLETAQEVLHDLLRANDRRVTIEEIQKRVAEHFNIKHRRHAFGPPRARRRAAAPGGDVSRQAADLALAARDRPQVRRPRPHHGHARGAQDRGAARRPTAPSPRMSSCCAGCWKPEPIPGGFRAPGLKSPVAT